MLQYYYNIKIMLIVYSLDQYVFLIMEYLALQKQIFGLYDYWCNIDILFAVYFICIFIFYTLT